MKNALTNTVTVCNDTFISDEVAKVNIKNKTSGETIGLSFDAEGHK
jgi:hypothetical protein